jgi:hypothetical protein
MHSGFTGIVDYAGLFPPASCTMDDAVSNFAEYRASADRWMLNRFVVAGMRLDEFTESVLRLGLKPQPQDPWGLSVVMGVNLSEETPRTDKFLVGPLADLVRIEAVETPIEAPGAAGVIVGRLPGDWEIFLEVPRTSDFDQMMKSIGAVGAMAKFRTGGVKQEAIPDPELFTSFLVAATKHKVPFKATAGLHHPWRGNYPLRYTSDSDLGRMFGFAAVLTATAALLDGSDSEVALAILEENDPQGFVIDADGIMWHEMRFSMTLVEQARRLAFRGFGSCSFREPVDELGLEVTA